MTEKVVIVGAGPIAGEYFSIAKELGYTAEVVGRGEASSENFSKQFGYSPLTGGVQANAGVVQSADKVIVAVSEDMLGAVTGQVIELGAKKVLVEKPGAATIDELEKLAGLASSSGSEVLIAYNRRSYQSVQELKRRLASDGGAKSCFFEFTERSNIISEIEKNPGVKENWLWHNSSHVIDLAFDIIGKPVSIFSLKGGELPWHPAGSTFVGMGKSSSGALFSYHANWEGPGGWKLEFVTEKAKYFLCPMERLSAQYLGKREVEELPIDYSIDEKHKPGFYEQTKSFLEGKNAGLVPLAEQVDKLPIYKAILNGTEQES